MPPGVPHPVDIYVGSRVRQRRKLLGLSQGELGDALGLTFQQIQKYERGANRIGASRLYQLSRILNVPIAFFFDSMPEDIKPMAEDGLSGEEEHDLDPRDDPEVMGAEETTALVKAYYHIGNTKKRKAVHDLIAALSKSPWDPEDDDVA